MDSPLIGPWLAGRHVLVTGATGFLGSALVEKLLRACAEIDTIFVLVRPRHGQDVKTRVHNILNTPLFARHSPGALEKVVGVAGDVTQASLGLRSQDRALLVSKVFVVFHSAASINFNSALKTIVNTNLMGTRRVLELCKEMKQLQALVYVSTAYCNCTGGEVVEERVYPPTHRPGHVIKMMEEMTSEEAILETPRLIGNHPNTYSFTKLLAENLLKEERGEIPVAVVRPTIILGTVAEPFPGWVDNVNTGAFAFIAGASRGIFRSILVDRTKIVDFVPCDHVVNLMIAAAWGAANHSPDMTVYHCSSGTVNPVTWGEYVDLSIGLVREHPCKILFWYPGAKCRETAWRNHLAVLLFQVLPAQLVDAAVKLSGRKGIVDSLVAIQHKFSRGQKHLAFYTLRQWQFKMSAADRLVEKMSTSDRKSFDFDVSTIAWPEFLKDNVLGLRHYFHKERAETLPQARKMLRWWRLLHFLGHLTLLLLLGVTLNLLSGDLWLATILPALVLLFLLWL